MLQRVFKSPMEFFDRTPVGRILSRFSKDVEVVDNQLPQSLYSCSYCFWMVNAPASHATWLTAKLSPIGASSCYPSMWRKQLKLALLPSQPTNRDTFSSRVKLSTGSLNTSSATSSTEPFTEWCDFCYIFCELLCDAIYVVVRINSELSAFALFYVQHEENWARWCMVFVCNVV